MKLPILSSIFQLFKIPISESPVSIFILYSFPRSCLVINQDIGQKNCRGTERVILPPKGFSQVSRRQFWIGAETLTQSELKLIGIKVSIFLKLIYFWFPLISCMLSFRALSWESGPIHLADLVLQFLSPSTTRFLITALCSASLIPGQHCLMGKRGLEGKYHFSAILFILGLWLFKSWLLWKPYKAFKQMFFCISSRFSSCSQGEDWLGPIQSIIVGSQDIFLKTQWMGFADKIRCEYWVKETSWEWLQGSCFCCCCSQEIIRMEL